MKILYLQAHDVACMHTYELVRGFLELGHEVFSNILNYDGLKPENGDCDLVIVSTSGARDNPHKPSGSYLFIDGRDTALRSKFGHENAVMFKSNGDIPGTEKLPSCVDPAWLKAPGKRSKRLAFYTGHHEHGRGDVAEWVRQAGGATAFIAPDNTPLNPRYPASSCNIYSPTYHALLQDSFISVNAPGGGVVTKKFFENIASGCVCLNYVPRNYYQPVADILDTIPDELNFPREAVLNFSDKKGFIEALERADISHAKATYAWAKKWGFKAKAQYVLDVAYKRGLKMV